MDTDAVGEQFARRLPRQADESEQAGHVGGAVERNGTAGERSHVDDHAPAAFAHESPGRLHGEERAGQVHIEGAAPVPFVHVEQGGARFDRGVVDERVNAAKVVLHLFDERLCGHFFSDVVHVDLGMEAAQTEFICQGFHILRRDVVERQARALRGKGFRQLTPGAAARAGDQHNFILIIHGASESESTIQRVSGAASRRTEGLRLRYSSR